MFDRLSSKTVTRPILALVVMLVGALSLGILTSAAASPAARAVAQIEPNAGTWKTWVLTSGSQLRLPAPPDQTTTQAEIAQLKGMESQRDAAALEQIAYWNDGGPAYRWNQIAVTLPVEAASPMGGRDIALVQVAIYDATIAAWDSKYAYNRPRPDQVDSSLTTVIPDPDDPSYPSEYTVVAGAASTVLAYLFPDQAQTFQSDVQQEIQSRLLAGLEFPSDAQAGLTLGQEVGQLVVAYGKADHSDAKFTGTIPTDPGHWTGTNPVTPMAGTWQPWVLTSGSEFRPPPPPAYNSDEEAKEMNELKTFKRTPMTNAIANFWQFGAGSARFYSFWNDFVSRAILENGWADDPPLEARAYALVGVVGEDSYIATFDGKYTYWAIRPFQLDPTFTPLFTTPNHPSYPAAHATQSTAMADVVGYLFPVEAAEATRLAQQAAMSRMWAGIHFPSDLEAGATLAQHVGDAVIAHAKADGSSTE